VDLYIIDDSHPWTVMRAAELLNWIKEGEYERVMNGDGGRMRISYKL